MTSVGQQQSYANLLQEVQPRPIRTKVEYREQLEWVEHLMGLDSTREIDMMIELLSFIIAAYEAKHFPIPEAPPSLVLDHLIESSGRTSSAIAHDLGWSTAMLSNCRKGRRALTATSILQLAQYFHVTPNVFFAREKQASMPPQSPRTTRTRAGRDSVDRTVLAAITTLGGADISERELCEHLEISTTRLRASLKRLRECGKISIEGQGSDARYSST